MKKSNTHHAKRGERTDGSEARSSGEVVPESAVERAAVDDASSVESRTGTAALQERIAALEESLLRAKADFQNLQRRSTIERSEAIRFANTELMRALMPILDDLERALAAAEVGEDINPIAEGVRLVYTKFLKALGEHGLEQIDALGQPFDPEVHEALMRQPSHDLPPGMVVQEVAKGYRLRDRVIRPAKVIVTQAAEEMSADSAGSDSPSPDGEGIDADV